MKKFLLFLFTALSFCIMTGCGERKMSDEEIQRKVDALHEKVVEAEKKRDFSQVAAIITEVLTYCALLEENNSYKKHVVFSASQRMGIAKYYLEDYKDAIIYLETALAVKLEETESILNQRLDMQIGLANAYEQLGDEQKRDYYLNLAEKRVRELENSDDKGEAYILERLYFFYFAKSKILQKEKRLDDALKSLLKLKAVFEEAKAFDDILYPLTLFHIGKIYYKLHIKSEARLFFQQTLDNLIEQRKFTAMPYIYLIHIYISGHLFDKALLCSEKLLNSIESISMPQEAKKNKAVILFCMGKIYIAKKQSREAEEYLRQAKELIPVPALNQLYGSVPEI